MYCLYNMRVLSLNEVAACMAVVILLLLVGFVVPKIAQSDFVCFMLDGFGAIIPMVAVIGMALYSVG